tara:strand:- start:47 stop:223 length:177 start_codon:yes stop_codon:yes gene_type:complete
MVNEEVHDKDISMLEATAQQLAFCHGRETPNDHDYQAASESLERWNFMRESVGLTAWV